MAGKNYRDAASQVDRNQEYDLADAVAKIREITKTKFDATVDVAVKLGVDPRHADQVVRGTVMLPHGTGKTVSVLVVCKEAKVAEAEEAGADFVGFEEYVEKIQNGWTGVDVIVATPMLWGSLAKLQDPRTTRSDAEPEIGNGYHGCSKGGQRGQGGQNRVPR